MKIVIKSLLLATIILMSNEMPCLNDAETCGYGESCSINMSPIITLDPTFNLLLPPHLIHIMM